MSSPLTLIHFSFFMTYGFTVYYAFYELHIPILSTRFRDFDPGQFKYLTIWGLIIQAVFFFICLLNDFYGSNEVAPKKAPLLRRTKDYFHAVYSFPLAMFVGVTFWALMFVDRELVLPKVLDPYFPSWLNHLMHTMIMVSALIEMVAAPRNYPTKAAGFTGLYILMISYLTWMHFIYYKSGVWVYPVMEVLSFPLRILFFLALFGLIGLIYLAGEALDKSLWSSVHSKSGSASKKKKSK